MRASLDQVAAFHRDTRALRLLTPPPLFVQIHRVEPLAENSISEFTLWFGPLPLRWKARHSHVDPHHGFRDTQIAGPMARWEHTHTFTKAGEGRTQIAEHIEYAHPAGVRGLLTRLIFPRFGLALMFRYRRYRTRRALESRAFTPEIEPPSIAQPHR